MVKCNTHYKAFVEYLLLYSRHFMRIDFEIVTFVTNSWRTRYIYMPGIQL